MEKYRVGVIGGTGMVGQRFVTLLENHPWFQLTAIAASSRSAGKTYEEAIGGRWALDVPMPGEAKDMVVLNAETDIDRIAAQVDFVFSAVDMKKEEIQALEEAYARRGCPVVSNNSAHRWTPDVPMVVPEYRSGAPPGHRSPAQASGNGARLYRRQVQLFPAKLCPRPPSPARLRPGAGAGLHLSGHLRCGQATFETWPEMVDNVIPYIGGEEEKSEQEPLKLWGRVEDGVIVNAAGPSITAQCLRVPASNGHMAAVFARFRNKPSLDEIKAAWAGFQGRAQELALPSAPKQFLHYFEEPDRPQTRLDRMTEGGMAVCIGRLRPDTQYDYKFVCLSHNTLRGAAGGAVLLAELLCAEGYIQRR